MMTADKNRARKRDSLIEKYAPAVLVEVMRGRWVNAKGKQLNGMEFIDTALWYAERLADAVLARKEKG